MNLVANASDPDDFSPRTTRVPLPSRDQVTVLQLHSLLNAATALNQLLPATDENGATVGPNDGGVVSAVEASLIKICARIDTIVDEGTRWTLTPQRELEAQLAEVYAAHLDVLKTQKATILAVNAPHRHSSPSLCKLENGLWAAVLGNVHDRDNCIIGVGDCPASALEDFDRLFEGKTKNEQQKLDGNGTETTGGSSGGGPGLGANSDEVGEDSGSVSPPV